MIGMDIKRGITLLLLSLSALGSPVATQDYGDDDITTYVKPTYAPTKSYDHKPPATTSCVDDCPELCEWLYNDCGMKYGGC